MNLQLSETQIKILKNAYGFESKKPGYRTHYCGSLKNNDLLFLSKNEFLTAPQTDGYAKGLGMFYLTKKAIEFLNNLKK